MLTKIYGMLWVLIAFAAALFFLTGNLTQLVGVVFGFITFGMIFMGMMNVLPAAIAHPPLPNDEKAQMPAKEKAAEVSPTAAVLPAH